ncbi:MAG: N-acetyltransferase family protein [Acidobacteriota bacterium]
MIERFPEQLTLRNGTRATARPMTADDGPGLLEFFRALPEEDRLFLQDDVTRSETVDRFLSTLSDPRVFMLIAEHDGTVVGHAELSRSAHGWTVHVGEVRVVVARAFQGNGLGTALARLLVRHAVNLGLDKMVAEVVDNQEGAKRAFGKLGFQPEAKLRGHVKDIHGVKRDLVIMANDVSHIWETMEALVADYSPMMGD